MLDVRQILRRFKLGQGKRAIARDLSLSRKTVAKYHTWAEAEGLLTGPLPEPALLAARVAAAGLDRAPPRTPFVAAPYRERILALRAKGWSAGPSWSASEKRWASPAATVGSGASCARWSR